MACVYSDGSVSRTAKLLLQNLMQPCTPEQLADQVKKPLFQVRSALREMAAAGLLAADGQTFVITDQGREKLV